MLGTTLLAISPLVLWHAYSGGEERALEQVARSWNAAATTEAQPKVELVAVPYDRLAYKLQAAIPRKHGPDLFILAHDHVGEWSAQGLLTPLDGLDGAVPGLDPARARALSAGLLPRTLDPLRAEGRLYGLPLAFKMLALFYRTDLLPRPPTTTDELLTVCRRLRDQREAPALSPAGGPGSGRYGLAYEAGDFFLHAAWLHGFGGAIIPPGEALPRLTTAPQEQALRFAQGLIGERLIPEEMSAVMVAQFFNDGRAASIISGPWFLGQINPGVPFAVAPLPRVSATGLPAAPLTTVEAAFLNPHSPRKAQALGFLSYLVSPPAALVRATVGRQSVATGATWNDPAVQGDAVLSAFFRQYQDMKPTASIPEMGAFWEPANQVLRQVLRGQRDPRAAMESGQRLLGLYLNQARARAGTRPYAAALGILILGSLGLLWRRRRHGPALWAAAKEPQARTAYRYLAPTVLSLLALVFVPFLIGAGMALFTVRSDGGFRFVGLANFTEILLARGIGVFEPLSFYYTLLVTLLWTAINVVLHVTIGVGLALLLRDPLLRLRAVYRVILLLPWAVPNYITAMIWKGMFNRQFGVINGLLKALGLAPVSWFASFWTALCANVTTNVWLGFPFMMIVSLGVLAQIPQEIEEAAMIDGATRWQRLRHIILPMLGPAMLPSVLLGAIWTFNMFNIVFLVSAGEPDGATDILISQAYRWAFTRGHHYGYAAAYAVLVFVVLLIQTTIVGRISARQGRS